MTKASIYKKLIEICIEDIQSYCEGLESGIKNNNPTAAVSRVVTIKNYTKTINELLYQLEERENE